MNKCHHFTWASICRQNGEVENGVAVVAQISHHWNNGMDRDNGNGPSGMEPSPFLRLPGLAIGHRSLGGLPLPISSLLSRDRSRMDGDTQPLFPPDGYLPTTTLPMPLNFPLFLSEAILYAAGMAAGLVAEGQAGEGWEWSRPGMAITKLLLERALLHAFRHHAGRGREQVFLTGPSMGESLSVIEGWDEGWLLAH